MPKTPIVNVGTANTLSFEGVPSRQKLMNLSPNDPKSIRASLELNELELRLFPLVTTGARLWPYLQTARDFRGRGKLVVLHELERLGRVHKLERFGPRSLSTFQSYESMLRRIDNPPNTVRKSDVKELQSFLRDKRRSFNGSRWFFNRYEKKWKSLFRKSMGNHSRQFADLIFKIQKNSEGRGERMSIVDIVESAISKILLRPNQYDVILRNGAFAYAFMRYMYGINTIEGVHLHTKAEDWGPLLLKRVRLEKSLARFQILIGHAHSHPPLGRLHSRLKKQGRMILASLKFHAFAALYLSATPRRAKKID